MRCCGLPSADGRYTSIDGLRGYLAFGPFLYHSCMWYAYIRTGIWELPKSNLYVHFGQGAVVMFFMITSFLFTSKILDSKKSPIDWLKLFVSRFMRIVPLYGAVMVALFVLVAAVSGGKLKEPVPVVLTSVAKWLTFKIWGGGDINGVQHTSLIVAGVTWTLVYEWYFYMALPLLALLLRRPPPIWALLLSIACVLYFEIWHFSVHYLAFGGGTIAALLFKIRTFRKLAVWPWTSIIVIAAIGSACALFPSAYEFGAIALYTLAFALIAAGSDIFGALSSAISRVFGEIAFGIYLIHGVVLFTLFTLVINKPIASAFSPTVHWLVIVAISPTVVGLSFLSFRYIEAPAMARVPFLTNYVRVKLKSIFTTDTAVEAGR